MAGVQNRINVKDYYFMTIYYSYTIVYDFDVRINIVISNIFKYSRDDLISLLP